LIDRLGDFVSRLLGSERSRVIVIGFDARLRLLVTGLAALGKEVSLIKTDTDLTVETKAPPGVSILYSSKADVVALQRAGVKAASCVLAATADDELNLWLCREARERFGVPLAITRLKMVEGITNWARLNDTGLARMTWGDTVRMIIGETHVNSTLSHLASISDRDQIADLEILSPVFIGRKIADLPLRECEVAEVTRDEILLPAFDSVELRLGDVLTLIGERGAVGQVRESLTSL
jgi:Trk K+ transport system NAD-binding subunit